MITVTKFIVNIYKQAIATLIINIAAIAQLVERPVNAFGPGSILGSIDFLKKYLQ